MASRMLWVTSASSAGAGEGRPFLTASMKSRISS